MYDINPELTLQLARLQRAQRERALELARLIDEAGGDRPRLAESVLGGAGAALISLGEWLKARAGAEPFDYASECS